MLPGNNASPARGQSLGHDGVLGKLNILRLLLLQDRCPIALRLYRRRF